ncbi:hypothetical protein SAMN03084138_00636 [Enterovibrio norvegicus DSM 15893]|uniref:Uncharacterized protein n=1 Tax=Enterovibrio norvegicus DSM 15893 TaxID=1121869 RepID=A0A1I5KG73_9GAMM|nr:hypothetical protein SAMN03084138_00636 [Enterovibrio norvegicus DSM 15893]
MKNPLRQVVRRFLQFSTVDLADSPRPNITSSYFLKGHLELLLWAFLSHQGAGNGIGFSCSSLENCV